MGRWPDQTVLQRFFQYVEVSDSCWLWTGMKNGDGYGIIKVAGKNLTTHRFLFKLVIGDVEHELDHLCRNRDCVNYYHLQDVTHAVNMARSIHPYIKAAITHCPHGHEYTEDNIYRDNGARKCRTCILARMKVYYASKH